MILYRETASQTWQKVELTYDGLTGWATGTVATPSADIAYLAQAVDPTGNVALALDHGNPFSQVEVLDFTVYLPVVLRP
ncbi:MAG: hypothetical protein ACE5FD_16855 [Anaerolineae bacterium]